MKGPKGRAVRNIPHPILNMRQRVFDPRRGVDCDAKGGGRKFNKRLFRSRETTDRLFILNLIGAVVLNDRFDNLRKGFGSKLLRHLMVGPLVPLVKDMLQAEPQTKRRYAGVPHTVRSALQFNIDAAKGEFTPSTQRIHDFLVKEVANYRKGVLWIALVPVVAPFDFVGEKTIDCLLRWSDKGAWVAFDTS